MSGLRSGLPELLQTLDVQVQCLTSVGKGMAQAFATGDDLRKIREFDDVRWIIRLIIDLKNVTPVFMDCMGARRIHESNNFSSFRMSAG